MVGTRDRLLVAVLEDTIEQLEESVAALAPATGIDVCLAIVSVACTVVLADPGPQRAVIGAISTWGPDVWLATGMETLFAAGIARAESDGAFASPTNPAMLADSLLLAHRGVLISAPHRVAAACRDPEAFDRADEVVIDRERNRHVAFGGTVTWAEGALRGPRTIPVIIPQS